MKNSECNWDFMGFDKATDLIFLRFNNQNNLYEFKRDCLPTEVRNSLDIDSLSIIEYLDTQEKRKLKARQEGRV
jgi:hypothetical protein